MYIFELCNLVYCILGQKQFIFLKILLPLSDLSATLYFIFVVLKSDYVTCLYKYWFVPKLSSPRRSCISPVKRVRVRAQGTQLSQYGAVLLGLQDSWGDKKEEEEVRWRKQKWFWNWGGRKLKGKNIYNNVSTIEVHHWAWGTCSGLPRAYMCKAMQSIWAYTTLMRANQAETALHTPSLFSYTCIGSIINTLFCTCSIRGPCSTIKKGSTNFKRMERRKKGDRERRREWREKRRCVEEGGRSMYQWEKQWVGRE